MRPGIFDCICAYPMKGLGYGGAAKAPEGNVLLQLSRNVLPCTKMQTDAGDLRSIFCAPPDASRCPSTAPRHVAMHSVSSSMFAEAFAPWLLREIQVSRFSRCPNCPEPFLAGRQALHVQRGAMGCDSERGRKCPQSLLLTTHELLRTPKQGLTDVHLPSRPILHQATSRGCLRSAAWRSRCWSCGQQSRSRDTLQSSPEIHLAAVQRALVFHIHFHA